MSATRTSTIARCSLLLLPAAAVDAPAGASGGGDATVVDKTDEKTGGGDRNGPKQTGQVLRNLELRDSYVTSKNKTEKTRCGHAKRAQKRRQTYSRYSDNILVRVSSTLSTACAI